MIAITGASGHLGKATLEFLLTKTNPESIVAIVRDPQKLTDFAGKGVAVRQGDYTDQASFVTSLAGVDTLLLISSAVLGDERVNQHNNVINAAKEAGVKHIFYTSAPNPSLESSFSPAIDHFRTENLILESGLTYTIFRNNLYLDLLPMVIGDAAQSGKLYYPAGDGKTSFVLRTDIAEGLANALTSEGHENKVYDIGSTTAWSFSDIVASLSSAQKTVEYIDIPGSAYEAELVKHLPPVVAKIYAGMAEGIKKNEFNVPSSTLKELLGREPVSLDAYLKSVA
ncbi:NAD(P)H-binding protein [Spirosoma sp. HMF3257]|uniref:SDR family NAD(P)-dependent oxidoreductase n=1 Tax=Spirosoma telluris TaxID=2183553 RepID=A0A327NLQ3_9BACT|nr:NAD(P)H-binding protein [Spirosoma telluris]RAI75685.1 SDR family NAD(P)-dependent oxidoreductase [Spirosoma telluris]